MYDIRIINSIEEHVDWSWEEAHSRRWMFDSCINYVDQERLSHNTFAVQAKYSFLKQIHPHFLRCSCLELVHDVNLKRSISRMILSDHPLEVERDRYHKQRIPRETRWCRHCMVTNDLHVGDEHHDIDVCPQHSIGRQHCCASLYDILGDGERLTDLLFRTANLDHQAQAKICRSFARFFSRIFFVFGDPSTTIKICISLRHSFNSLHAVFL